MNIEDLFQLKKTPERPILTPCTAEALLVSGTSVKDLLPQSHKTIGSPIISPSGKASPPSPKQIKLRENYHEAQRMKVFEKARQLRNDFKYNSGKSIGSHKVFRNVSDLAATLNEKDFGFQIKAKAAETIMPTITTKKGQAETEDEKLGTIIKQERQRLEKIKQKQQMEIQQLLSFELKQAQLLRAAEERLKKDAERKAQLKRLQQKKAKERQAFNRAKMLMKLEQEKQLIQRSRQLALEQARRDKMQARKEKMEAKLRGKERLRLEKMRQEKQQKLKQQTEEIFRKQQTEIQEKMRRNQERERLREIKQAEERERLRIENEKRSFKNKERIQNNIAEMQKREIDRLRRYKLKQHQVKLLRNEKEKQLEKFNAAKAMERELGELKRKEILKDVRRRQKYEKELLSRKQNEISNKLNEQLKMREVDRELRREEMRLKQEMKKQNVARERRKDEFRKHMLQKKIHETKNRIDGMMMKKDELLRKRLEAGVLAKKKREELGYVMEKIRKTKQWHKADEILRQLEEPPSNNNSLSKKQKSMHHGEHVTVKETFKEENHQKLSNSYQSPYNSEKPKKEKI